VNFDIGTTLAARLAQAQTGAIPLAILDLDLERVILRADIWPVGWAPLPADDPASVDLRLTLAVGGSTRLIPAEHWALGLVDAEGADMAVTIADTGGSYVAYTRWARVPRARLAGLRVTALHYTL
jgi:hypothetical protein